MTENKNVRHAFPLPPWDEVVVIHEPGNACDHVYIWWSDLLSLEGKYREAVIPKAVLRAVMDEVDVDDA